MIDNNSRERIDSEGFHHLDKRSNLTSLQLIYWIGQSLLPDEPLFNTVVNFRFRNQIDVGRFSQAVDAVISASDSLRTVIHTQNNIPQRIILEKPPRPLDLLDFSNEKDPQAALQSWLSARIKKPVDITKSAYDMALIKLGEGDYYWYNNQHHIITDAGSTFLTFDYVMKAYDAARRGEAVVSEIPDFEAYVALEKSYQTTKRYQKSMDYWRRELANGIDTLQIYGRNIHKRRPNVKRVPFYLDLQRTAQLKAATSRDGVIKITAELGLFNVLLTLYFALLFHITGSNRLAAMLPFHNRPTEKLKRSIGLLMEIAPILVEVDQEETFADLTRKVGKVLHRTLIHYQCGSTASVENKVYDLMFNFHRRPALEYEGEAVYQEMLHPHVGSNSFALHIHEFEETGQFACFFDFHEDLFTPEAQTVTVQAFSQLIDAYLAPESPQLGAVVASLPLPEEQPVDSTMPANITNGTPVKPGPGPEPGDELEMALLSAWRSVLQLPDLGVNDGFFDMGGNSWMAVQLIGEIQNETGLNLPISILSHAGTISEMAALIRQGRKEAEWRALVSLREEGNNYPCYCVHGVTGDILWLRELGALLDDNQPFYGLQARGLDGESDPFTSIEEMAAFYNEQIRVRQPQGPYFLSGYCMGGVIAYEMARQLIAAGEEVPLLLVIDPPPTDLSERLRVDGRFLIKFMRNTPFWFREFMRLDPGEITARVRRKSKQALQSLRQKARQRRGDHAGMNATDIIDQADELPAFRQHIIETNLAALTNYHPAGFQQPVIIFEARSRPLLNPVADTEKWRSFTSGPLTIERLPGSHSTILKSPHVEHLARRVQVYLNESQEPFLLKSRG